MVFLWFSNGFPMVITTSPWVPAPPRAAEVAATLGHAATLQTTAELRWPGPGATEIHFQAIYDGFAH